MTRTKTVPTLVFLMGIAAIIAITGLQHRAAASRDAQVQLATLRSDLAQLQVAPLKPTKQAGVSPAVARGPLLTGKRRIAQTLADLRRQAPVPALDALGPPIRATQAALGAIFVIGASDATPARCRGSPPHGPAQPPPYRAVV